MLIYHGFQCIDIIELNPFDSGNIRIYITRNSNIDQENSPALTPRHQPACLPCFDHIMRSARRGNDYINTGRVVHCAIKWDCLAANTLSKTLAAFDMPICYEYRLDPVCAQMLGCQLCHLACTKNQCTASPKAPERCSGKFHCRITHRYRAMRNACFRAHTLSCCNRTMEKQIKHCTRCPCLTGNCIGFFYLRQNLPLSEDKGV